MTTKRGSKKKKRNTTGLKAAKVLADLNDHLDTIYYSISTIGQTTPRRGISGLGEEVPTNPPEVGVKHDSRKPKLSIVPTELLEGAARALTYGAEKYGRGNYRLGMDHCRILDAAIRHLYAYAHREDQDPESMLCHLDHAAANLGMLMYYVANNVGKDDR